MLSPLVGLIVILDVEPLRISDVLVYTALPMRIACASWVHFRLHGPSSLHLLGLLVGLNAALAEATSFTISRYILPGVLVTC